MLRNFGLRSVDDKIWTVEMTPNSVSRNEFIISTLKSFFDLVKLSKKQFLEASTLVLSIFILRLPKTFLPLRKIRNFSIAAVN